MIRLFGAPVAEADARRLVTTLLADDDYPYAVAAARTISHGLDTDAAFVVLTVHQRDAVLAVLEDLAADGLGELREALLNDALERRGAPSRE